MGKVSQQFIAFIYLVCICVHTWYCTHVVLREQLERIGFLPQPCGIQELNLNSRSGVNHLYLLSHISGLTVIEKNSFNEKNRFHAKYF